MQTQANRTIFQPAIFSQQGGRTTNNACSKWSVRLRPSSQGHAAECIECLTCSRSRMIYTLYALPLTWVAKSSLCYRQPLHHPSGLPLSVQVALFANLNAVPNWSRLDALESVCWRFLRAPNNQTASITILKIPRQLIQPKPSQTNVENQTQTQTMVPNKTNLTKPNQHKLPLFLQDSTPFIASTLNGTPPRRSLEASTRTMRCGESRPKRSNCLAFWLSFWNCRGRFAADASSGR